MRQITLDQVDQWMPRLIAHVQHLVDKKLTRDDVVYIAKAASAVTAKSGKPRKEDVPIVFHQLAYMEGKVIGMQTMKRILLHLMGNWGFIRDGSTIPDWSGGKESTDLVVLGLLGSRLDTTGRHYLLAVKLKTGLPAGIIKCTDIPDYTVRQFLDHESGVGALQCADEEVSGMHIRCVVEMPNINMLKLSSLTTTEAMKKYNKSLTLARSESTKCTKGIPCNTCDKTVAECPLAVLWKRNKEEET